MELFTIIYSFMSHSLGLSGATKEVFAVIFGFWRKKQAPVEVANSVIRSITGLSHSSIVDAKNKLVAFNLISILEIRGKPSLYEVHIPPYLSEILPPSDFNNGTSRNQTGSDIRPKYNKDKLKKTKKAHGNNSLDVGDPSEFTGDDKI